MFMQTLVLARTPTEGSRNNDEINVNSTQGQPLALDVSMSRVQYDMAKRWDGKMPTVTSGAMPLLQLPKPE